MFTGGGNQFTVTLPAARVSHGNPSPGYKKGLDINPRLIKGSWLQPTITVFSRRPKALKKVTKGHKNSLLRPLWSF